MADQDRATGHPLIDDLLKRAQDYSFFQVVSLLERLCRPKASVGGDGPADGEVLRFRPDLSLAFPVSDMAGLEAIRTDPPQFRLTTTFLGLYGTTSPLPLFYTEDLMAQEEEEEPVRSFLDLFHHRLLSMFYRCWAKYRYHVQFEPSGEDRFSERMFAFLGSDIKEVARKTGLSGSRLLRYAGLFNQRPRSASALEGLLSDFFDGMEVHIEQCTARWVSIPMEQQPALGRRNCGLGQDCTLGNKVLSRQSGFRLSMGPMSHDRYVTLLPGSEDLKVLWALIKLFVQDRFDADVELLLRGDEAPALRLSSKEGDGPVSRLGQTSWFPVGSGNGGPRRVLFQFVPADRQATVH
jgi:type VI secretion system protein ImpH